METQDDSKKPEEKLLTTHSIDYNDHYGLQLDYDPALQQLNVTCQTNQERWAPLMNAFSHQLCLGMASKDHGDQRQILRPIMQTFLSPQDDATLVFHPVTREFTLQLGQEPIGSYSIRADGKLSRTSQRLLTVDELRRMGTFYHCEPYSQRRKTVSLEKSHALLATAKSAVFTDFHTHSSGQISAQGLIDVAMMHTPYYYPLSLLEEAGIDVSYERIPHTQMIPRIPFLDQPGKQYPAEVEGADLHILSADELQLLKSRMAMPSYRQSTFTEMEHDGYRFRYPFTKDPMLAGLIQKKTVEELTTQGIDYASSSFVGLDKPGTLTAVHEAMADLELHPLSGTAELRFMVGIPRSLSHERMKLALEKAKVLLDSPYVVGVDFLGYENNKTSDFIHLLDAFCAWANEHKPGTCIRVHAGENDKNPDNVKDVLKIAVKYPDLIFLLGHALYGIDKEAMALSKPLSHPKPRLWMEYNPSSNIALNNLDDLRDIPFNFAMRNGICFIVSSDSAGMYQTSAEQLGLAAYYGGLDAQGFEKLRDNQLNLLEHQRDFVQRNVEAITGWDTAQGKQAYLQKMIGRLADVDKQFPSTENAPDPGTPTREKINAVLRKNQVIPIEPGDRMPELAGKSPIIFMGSSGRSWRRMGKIEQREAAIAVDMVIHAVNEKAYIGQGRSKGTGLSKVIDCARMDVDKKRIAKRQSPLDSFGLEIESKFDLEGNYEHLTHMGLIPGSDLDLADGMVNYVFEHDGVLALIGGSAYTRDAATKAHIKGIREDYPDNKKMMVMLKNIQGASAEKAKVLHPDYGAADGMQLVKKIAEIRKDLFPKDFLKKTNLQDLYDASRQRVGGYNYNQAEPKKYTSLHGSVSTRSEATGR